MKKLVIVSVGVALILGACNKSNDDKPVSFDDRVPETLNFVEPVPGVAVTAEQKAEMTALFNTKAKLNLPPGNLVFPDVENNGQGMTTQEKQNEEEKLKKEDLASYKVLKEVQGTCSTPKPFINNTFPQRGTQVAPKVGDVYSVDFKTSITSLSPACPITGDQETNAKVVVERVIEKKDAKNKDVEILTSGSAGMGGKLKLLIHKPEYQKLLNARGVIVDTNVSGITASIEKKSKTFVTAKLYGSYITLEKEIGYDVTVDSVSRQVEGKYYSEFVMKTELKFPTFTATTIERTVYENGKREVRTDLPEWS